MDTFFAILLVVAFIAIVTGATVAVAKVSK